MHDIAPDFKCVAFMKKMEACGGSDDSKSVSHRVLAQYDKLNYVPWNIMYAWGYS